MTALYLSTSSCGERPSSSASTRIGVPCSSVPDTMRTSCPAIRMYRLKTSEGTPKPATWPMWRGPLVYGQAVRASVNGPARLRRGVFATSVTPDWRVGCPFTFGGEMDEGAYEDKVE